MIHLLNFQEQIKEFFERIALTQLKITKREYSDETSQMDIHEIALYLSSKAKMLEREIPDCRVLLQSILDDNKIAKSATFDWYPPEVSN